MCPVSPFQYNDFGAAAMMMTLVVGGGEVGERRWQDKRAGGIPYSRIM